MDPARNSQYQEVLAHSAMFKGVEPAALHKLLQHSLMLEARAGDQIYFQNMRGGIGLHVILEGEVEVYRARNGNADGDPEHLSTLKAGQFFGEYSLIDELKTSASARALTDVRLLFIPRGQFMQLVDGDALIGKQVYRNMLLHLIARLRLS